jgi:CRISPR-associated protein Csx10
MEVTVREGDPAFAYARIIEREAWRQEISRASLRVAAVGGGRKAVLGVEVSKKGAPSAGGPPMSQLGALRSVLGRLRDKTHRDVVMSWLDHLEKTKNRREKWSENSLRAVRTLIEEPEAVWRLLGIETAELIVTEGGQDVLKEELWAQAVKALVEACVRAHKRELEAV